MKNTISIAVVICCLTFTAMKSEPPINKDALQGAWSADFDEADLSLLFADGYCMFTHYSRQEKKFVSTSGGPYTIKDDKIIVKTEFNSADKTDVGKTNEYIFSVKDNMLTTEANGQTMNWNRIDNGDKNLAGNWRITQRKQDDKMIDIPLRARRTLKLLTATRFQWAAINIETGEFSGTGGGTYTFTNGKYTEQIDFFSRDSSRVGMKLSFDGKLDNGKWIHSGKSSKGDPIYEVWERMK